MKAIVINAYGPADELTEAALPVPLLRPHEVLVETHSASINAVDWKIRAGYMKDKLAYSFPLILGLDLAGTVKEIGPEVTRFKVGDAVLGKTNLADNGCYAEFVPIHEQLLELKPDNISFEEAAALPLSGMTAWQALTDFAQLKPGETVLIQGGSGGVGSLAVQFAKAIGAHVIATASSKNEALVHKIGADRMIAYDKQDFVAAIDQKVDVVFDMIGGDVLERSYEVLARGGRLVTIWGQPIKALEEKYGVTSSTFVTLEGGDHLAQIVALAKAGKVRPVVGTTIPMTAKDIQNAHRQSEKGHAQGKTIITVK